MESDLARTGGASRKRMRRTSPLPRSLPTRYERAARRYRNDGDGVFVGEDILGALTIEHGEAQWGDCDGDALRIYRNDAETWVPIEVIACAPCDGWFDLTAATWADYDSDGDMDILLTGTYNSGSQIEGRARIYANEGGVFVESGNDLPAPRASGTRGGTFSWLDLDGDGDLDYFIAGQYFVPGGNGLVEAQMHAYRNDVAGHPLAATVEETSGTVFLSWRPASDDLTPTAALTYDIVVYRDGIPVANPHRLPEPGNVSAVTSWVLAGLPDGAYTWTLRAVDSAYNGGPVLQGTFSLGAPVAVGPTGRLPRTYAFDPGYPNPFKRSTAFRFALPEQANVSLAVYDVAGRLVTRLADGTRAPGVHEIRWDASGLASGAYCS